MVKSSTPYRQPEGNTDNLPANSLKRYRRNLELKYGRRATVILMSDSENSLATSGPSSKKRQAEDTDLPISQAKRHRSLHSAIQADMAEYSSYMESLDNTPSTSSGAGTTTGNTRSAKLRYVPYQAKSSKHTSLHTRDDCADHYSL